VLVIGIVIDQKQGVASILCAWCLCKVVGLSN